MTTTIATSGPSFFHGRSDELSVFAGLLKKRSPQVLNIHGMGGVGKSSLIEAMSGSAALDDGHTYPQAMISFRPGRTPTSAPEALWEIRTQLKSDLGNIFLRFDLIWSIWWEQTYRVPILRNQNILGEDAESINDLISEVKEIPFVGSVVSAANFVARSSSRVVGWYRRKSVQDWFNQHVATESLSSFNLVSGLRSLHASRLHDILPLAFAADLADRHLIGKKVERPLVFVDTFERIADTAGFESGRNFIEALAQSLFTQGSDVLLTVAGRDPLRWGQRLVRGEWVSDAGSQWRLIERKLAPHIPIINLRLRTFKEAEAIEYLCEVRGVSKPQAINLYRVTLGLPIALAAAADTMRIDESNSTLKNHELNMRTKGMEPLSKQWTDELGIWIRERLFDRIAKRGNPMLLGLVRAAAVPRWFTAELLYSLAGNLPAFQELFEELISFGFVERFRVQSEGEIVAYSIHPVLRKHLIESVELGSILEELHVKSHDFLESLANETPGSDFSFQCIVECVYHRLELVGDFSELNDLVTDELGEFRTNRASMLIGVCSDVSAMREQSGSYREFFEARLSMAVGRYDKAIHALVDLLPQIDQSSDSSLHRNTLMYLAEAYRLIGSFSRSLDHFDSLEKIHGNSDRTVAFVAEWGRSLNFKLLDRYSDSLASCEVAESLISEDVKTSFLDAHTFGNRQQMSDSRNLYRHKAEVLRQLGNYAKSEESIHRFCQLYESSPASLGYAYGVQLQGHIARMQCRFDEAANLAEVALAIFEERGNTRGILSTLRLLGQAKCGARDLEAATLVFETLTADTATTYPYANVYGELGLGETCFHQGEYETSRNHFRNALKSSSERTFRIEEAYARLALLRNDPNCRDQEEAFPAVAKLIVETGQLWSQFFLDVVHHACLGTIADRKTIRLRQQFVFTGDNDQIEDEILEAISQGEVESSFYSSLFLNFP